MKKSKLLLVASIIGTLCVVYLFSYMGNAVSIDWAGFYYQNGYASEIDYEKAMDYYRKASDMNIPKAFCSSTCDSLTPISASIFFE